MSLKPGNPGFFNAVGHFVGDKVECGLQECSFDIGIKYIESGFRSVYIWIRDSH